MTDLAVMWRGATASEQRKPRARRRARRESTLKPWSWSLLCVATVGGALLFGGLHTPTVVAMALLIFASALLAARGMSWSSVPAPAKLLFGLALFTALQALPLPRAVVTALSPAAAEVWQRAWEVTRPGASGFMSLSVDRGASALEALKWAMYGAAFIAAAKFGASRSMARGLLLPFGSALLIAFVTLGHGLARASSVYGVYEPTFGPSIWHVGPFLNPNHLASYLNLGLFCGLGLLVARRKFLPRWLLGLAIAFMVPNAIVAGSRGGIVGLIAGVLTFFIFLPRRRQADSEFGPVPRLALLATFATVSAIAAGFTALLMSENTARELYQTNVDKIRLWAWAGRLACDYPLFGVGRGAFEGVFAAYRTGVNNEIYTHPENLVAQWLGEWGLIVGALALGAFLWLFRPRRLGTRWSAVASGGAAGVAAVFVQNFADFGLEVPAIALAVITALGVCWGHAQARRRGQGADTDIVPRLRLAHLPLALAALLLSGLPVVLGSQLLPLERLSLANRYRALEDPKSDLTELGSDIKAAIDAHPAEPYFYRLGALLTWRAGGDPMPWLQRALDRGPSIGRTHLLVARVLADRKAVRQALLELRLATTFDPALAPITARAAATWTRDYSMLLRSVPSGAEGAKMLVAIAKELPAALPLRERLLLEAVSRDPQRKAATLLLAQEVVRQLETKEGGEACSGDARRACVDRAERWLRKLEALPQKGDVDVLLLRTRMLRATGDAEKALEILSGRCPNLTGRPRALCRKTQLELASKTRAETWFVSAARDYLADTCTDSEGCSTALEEVADLNVSRGDLQGAFSLYDRATRERSDDRLLMKLARVAARIGAHQRATNALERIRGKDKFEPEYSRLLKASRVAGVGTIRDPARTLEAEPRPR